MPGLRVLVPFERGDVDAYLLNLFAVKPERARSLENEGLAIRSLSPAAPDEMGVAIDLQVVLGRRPYAERLAGGWREWMSGDAGDVPRELVSGLTLYCRAWDESLPMADRFHALRGSHSQQSHHRSRWREAQAYCSPSCVAPRFERRRELFSTARWMELDGGRICAASLAPSSFSYWARSLPHLGTPWGI